MTRIKALFLTSFIHGVVVCSILITMPILFTDGIALAQMKTCECEFSSKDYQAYGTNGACGIFMYNKGRTCEISFAGTGANKQMLKRMLGENAWETNVKLVSQLFQQYLAYTSRGDKSLYLDSGFIRDSLVVLVRGAIFRESALKAGLPLSKIDTTFVGFSKKYSGKIAATFRMEEKPFKIDWGEGMIFSVGEGYVEMNYRDVAIVRAVYFSTLQR
ncbi:MAG: hypothetical protein ABIN18_21425 [Pseudomonadota bacterium]